jgi:serine/threonine protein kinase
VSLRPNILSDLPPPAGPGGVRLGKYRLLAELGRGGMATVHLAIAHGPAGFSTGFNKLLVIKQICSQFSEENDLVAMFLDEARLSARLNHPNVVQTNEIGEQDGRYFIAMEYLEGQPLNRVLRRMARSGGMPLAMHVRVITDALAGLHYAHELADYDGTPLGIVHRDVNPQNVFVTYDGTVKVVDFGIAKARSSIEQTQAGVLKGKIMYMAPEQATAEKVDRRADVFSAGVMLWEAVTGKRPWVGVRDLDVLRRLKKGLFPRLRSIQPDVSERLEAIIEKAVAREPGDRHATAAELAAELDAYLDELPEHIHTRDVGAAVLHLFGSELSQIRRVIDAQIRADFAEGLDSAVLPVIDLPTMADPMSDPDLVLLEVTPSALEPSSIPSLTPVPSLTPAVHKRRLRPRRLARRAPHPPSSSPPPMAKVADSVDTTNRDRPTRAIGPAPRRRWLGAVVAGGLLLVALLAVGLGRHRNGSPAVAMASVRTHTDGLSQEPDPTVAPPPSAAPAIPDDHPPAMLDRGTMEYPEPPPSASHSGPPVAGMALDGKGRRKHQLDDHNPYGP